MRLERLGLSSDWIGTVVDKPDISAVCNITQVISISE